MKVFLHSGFSTSTIIIIKITKMLANYCRKKEKIAE